MLRKIKKYIFVFLVIVCGIALISEVVLRVTYKEQLKTRVYPLIYKPDSTLGYAYIPSVKAEISIPGIHKKFEINHIGYYGREFNVEKDTSKYRIAIVGSSEASGIWLNSDSSFGFILQNMFNSKHIQAEVVNFSIDGQVRDLYNVSLINQEVIKYRPDIVLLNTSFPFIQNESRRTTYKNYVIAYNGENELSEKWGKAKVDFIESHTVLICMYNISYIIRALCRYYIYHYRTSYGYNLKVFVEKKVQTPDILFIPCSVKKTVEMLKETQKKLQDINSDLVLYYYYDVSTQRKDIFNQTSIKFITLNIPNNKDMHYPYDSHFSEYAQHVIAENFISKFNIVNNRILGIHK